MISGMAKPQGGDDTSRTVKVTVTVPADVLDEIDSSTDNRSAFVTAALRVELGRQQVAKLFAKHGNTPTPEGVQRMRDRVRALEASRVRRSAA
jgi:hypothetical protein